MAFRSALLEAQADDAGRPHWRPPWSCAKCRVRIAQKRISQPQQYRWGWGYRPYVHGPYNVDLSANKTVPIHEKVRFVQAEFLNATNHPTFTINNIAAGAGLTSTSFGQQTSGNPLVSGFSSARRIEFRANLEF